MPMKKWYLISCDVRDPKRLRKAADILLCYGVRLQMSVYRCRLSGTEFGRLHRELSGTPAEGDDLLITGI
ncbi:MAG: CRISPR-associated endonuclease Cas2 [Planctomycetia bacterium]|nr:CRISPR-associated endonuclease Cas2 [Planctomycetia bacterium]